MWNDKSWTPRDFHYPHNYPVKQSAPVLTYFSSSSRPSTSSYHPYKRPYQRNAHSSYGNSSHYNENNHRPSSSFCQSDSIDFSDRKIQYAEMSYAESWNDFEALPPKPVKVVLYTRKSAKECLVQWQRPKLAPEHDKSHAVRIFENSRPLTTVKLDPNTSEYSVKTNPGKMYIVEYRIKDASGNITAQGTTEFRATFSKDEMSQLLKKAVDYVSVSRRKMHPFRVLYRCKPQCYWDDIQIRTNNIMMKYIKDDNGQAGNPTNGNIFGLFFSARLLPNGKMPLSSPFGNIRMMLPAKVLLDPKRVNMYFCDFYCNKLTHYVTIVVCVKGTKTDAFCNEKLVLVAPSNPFLRIESGDNGYEFYVNKKVWVEVYWSENVPLCWGKFDRIIATGFGTSRVGGLRHNKQCTICNIYPIGGIKEEITDDYEDVSYIEEEDANETNAQDNLEKMISSMGESGLPKQDCEDIVFLVNDLVDQVACDTDVEYTDNGEADFGDTYQPRRSANRKGIASKFQSFRGAISKRLDRVHSAIVKKKNQMRNKFTKY